MGVEGFSGGRKDMLEGSSFWDGSIVSAQKTEAVVENTDPLAGQAASYIPVTHRSY